MLYSTRPRRDDSAAAISPHVPVVMCRASARGWTVMPGAPAAMQTSTASRTLGTSPPRELRSVATLLTLTLRRGGTIGYPRCSFTAPAISEAHAWISRWSRPSIITLSNGSVPE